MTHAVRAAPQAPTPTAPRLGFLGVGWIGRHRLEALVQSGAARVAAIADPSAECAARAAELAPQAALGTSLDELLALDLDGVVIATPSALHAEQALAALDRGVAVFCQKPLGRTAGETRRVVATARAADRRLDVDLSYRHLRGAAAIRDLVSGGALGQVYAVDLVFHNAYGPDKPWFYDPELSGGGCVMDLGIHLVDLALWMLGHPAVTRVSSRLFAKGEPLVGRGATVEDYAVAQLDLAGGAVARVACSWNLPAGTDAMIGAELFGTRGGAALRNVGGSFYDFEAHRFEGTARSELAAPPDDWGGRALVAWARSLVERPGFDPEAERLVEVAEVLDRIYDAAA